MRPYMEFAGKLSSISFFGTLAASFGSVPGIGHFARSGQLPGRDLAQDIDRIHRVNMIYSAFFSKMDTYGTYDRENFSISYIHLTGEVGVDTILVYILLPYMEYVE